MRARPGKHLASLCLSLGLLTACQAGTAPSSVAASPKINPQVTAAAHALMQGATTQVQTDTQGRLRVYVYVTDTKADTLGMLDHAGLVGAEASAEMGLVQGWIAARDLDRLAALSCVETITLPRYALPR